jgi:hypothetical protein
MTLKKPTSGVLAPLDGLLEHPMHAFTTAILDSGG